MWSRIKMNGFKKIKLYKKQIEVLTQSKNYAYYERDQLVCVLSKLFPAHLTKHPESDLSWEKDWMTIVCVHLPTGQATWHIPDSELKYFTHLKYETNHWDGHTTEEKYDRLMKLGSKGC